MTQYKLLLPQFNNICVKPTKTCWMWPFFVLQYCCFQWFYFVWSYCDQFGQILHGMMSLNILMTLQQPHPYGMWLLLRSLFSNALQTLILSRNIFILWVAFIISTVAYTITYVKKMKSWFEITISKLKIVVIAFSNFYY